MFFQSQARTSIWASPLSVHSDNPWNVLPMEVKSTSSLDILKRLLDSHQFPRYLSCIFIYLLLLLLLRFCLFFFLWVTALRMPTPICVKSHYAFVLHTELPYVSLINYPRNWPYLENISNHYDGHGYEDCRVWYHWLCVNLSCKDHLHLPSLNLSIMYDLLYLPKHILLLYENIIFIIIWYVNINSGLTGGCPLALNVTASMLHPLRHFNLA